MKTKTAMITIAGRPNVGKSTLANALVGEKIAIVSHKPQTTRNRICAIVNRGDTQLVFIDTPGFHQPAHEARRLYGERRQSVGRRRRRRHSDGRADRKRRPSRSRSSSNRSRAANVPAILVINKIDTVEKETLLPVIAAYQDLMDFDGCHPHQRQVARRRWTALHAGAAKASRSRRAVASSRKDMVDRSCRKSRSWPRSSAKSSSGTWKRRFPHGTAVEITKFSERDDGIIDLDATIYCEKASHKGIIIGKNGQMLKKISTDARKDCERFMGTKVFLQTWVTRQGKLARQRLHDLQLRLRRPGSNTSEQHQAHSFAGGCLFLKINVDK